MKRILFLSKVAFFLIAAALTLSGCFTSIGYGVGSWIDNGRPHDSVAIFTDIDDYTGQQADVIFRDSIFRNVTFESVKDEPELNYMEDYGQFVRSDPKNPAAIPYDDTIVVQFYKKTGPFEGYYPSGVIVNYRKLELFDFEGLIKPKQISIAELIYLFKMNLLPIRATLTFRENGKHFDLTNRDFQNVIILPHKSYGRWIGTGIGAVIDISLFALFVYSNTPPRGNGSFLTPHWNGGALH